MRTLVILVATALTGGCGASDMANMTESQEPENALVVRTDFSDDTAWQATCAAIQEPSAEFGFPASVDFLSDRAFADLEPRQLASRIRERTRIPYVFVVDRETLTRPDRPVLLMDLSDENGRSFRVIPSEIAGVESNLSIANMGFEEFADAVDDDGVFRGFPID